MRRPTDNTEAYELSPRERDVAQLVAKKFAEHYAPVHFGEHPKGNRSRATLRATRGPAGVSDRVDDVPTTDGRIGCDVFT